ncbi:MAG: sulfite exporter TauE/SafE family protein [Planctomycetota bacterium]
MATVFVASLLGSLHCVGMCGPFALLASSTAQSRKSAIVPTLAYSGGRLVSYILVGVVFGACGFVLNASTSFSVWQQTASLAAGILMIAVGLVALARAIGWQIPMPKTFRPIQRILQNIFEKSKDMAPVHRALTIGALSSLMPCGWLYTFAITAAGTGSPLTGAILMVAFWAGTVPTLVALMLGFGQIGSTIQRHVPVAMASLVIAVGIFTISNRVPVAIAGKHFKVVNGDQELIQQISNIDHDNLPCCQCRGKR